MAPIADDTLKGIEAILAGFGGAGNPADVTGNIARPTLVDLTDLFTGDPAVDLMVVGTTGSAIGQRSLDIASSVKTARTHTKKPFVGLWFSAMSGTTPRIRVRPCSPRMGCRCSQSLQMCPRDQRPLRLSPEAGPSTGADRFPGRRDGRSMGGDAAGRASSACDVWHSTAQLHETRSVDDAIAKADGCRLSRRAQDRSARPAP